MKRFKGCFLAAVLLLSVLLSAPGAAADTGGQGSYKPIDVVLVIDNSGSMKVADPERMVFQAVRTFANMMPAADSRLGIVSFTHESKISTVINGQPAFLPMLDPASLDSVRDYSENTEIDGKADTAIGNGLKSAIEIFKAAGRPRDQASRAILLFTDGVDDFENEPAADQPRLAVEADGNLKEAQLWCKDNDCPVYCIGLNYALSDGKDSINDQGKQKLENIASATGGNVQYVSSTNDIEDDFSEILAKMCELIFVQYGEIPGDGQLHEFPIKVTAGIVEMNIRISCSTQDALKAGTIELIDPSGQTVLSVANGNAQLSPSGDVRHDTEHTTESIKVINPALGDWRLSIRGVTGDQIKIGLLNHYRISLDASLIVPPGNAPNKAYKGNTVTISAVLLDNGVSADPAIYNDVTEAEAVITPRSGGQPATVKLSLQNGRLAGSFTVPEEAIYDVAIRVATESFEKTASLVIETDNHPLELTGAVIEKQQVDVGKTIEIPDLIKTYVRDEEGDPIYVSAWADEPEKLGVTVEGDKLVLKGLKWGNEIVTTEFRDEQGNTVQLEFNVYTRDLIKIILLSSIPFIIAVIVAILAILALLRTKRVAGVFEISLVQMSKSGYNVTVGKPVRMRAVTCARGRKTSMQSFMQKYAMQIVVDPTLTMEQQQFLNEFFMGVGMNQTPLVLSKIAINGTILGKKGFVLTIPAGLPVRLDSLQPGAAVKRRIEGMRSFTLEIRCQNGDASRITITYQQQARQ